MAEPTVGGEAPRQLLGGERSHEGAVLVVGLGRFGSALAPAPSSSSATRCSPSTSMPPGCRSTRRSSPTSCRPTRRASMRCASSAPPTSSTAVVCIGTDVEASVLTAAALVDLGVPNIWAKAITRTHGTHPAARRLPPRRVPRSRDGPPGRPHADRVDARVHRARRGLCDRRDDGAGGSFGARRWARPACAPGTRSPSCASRSRRLVHVRHPRHRARGG